MSSKGCTCEKSHPDQPCNHVGKSTMHKLNENIIHDGLTPLETNGKKSEFPDVKGDTSFPGRNL